MKLKSFSKLSAGMILALVVAGGMAVAHPTPRSQSSSQNGKKKPLYPNATRKAPALDLHSQSTADKLNKGLNAGNAGNLAKAIKILQPLADGSEGQSKYAQALALQGLANIAYRKHDPAGAIANMQKALEIGVMPNDTYFQLMYELAQFYAVNQQPQKALDTLHKWRKEGKRQTADSYGLEGVLDYHLKKYKKAIAAIKKADSLSTKKPRGNWTQILDASYEQTGQVGQAIGLAKKQLAADPSDAATRHNLIVLLLQADKDPEALQEMELARSKGEFTTSVDYINLAKLYLNIGINSGKDPKPYAEKSLAVLNEGEAKDILKPDYALYKLEGDAELVAGDRHAALVAYTKASPMGHDGDAELHRSELLAITHKYDAARNAARQAIAKGTNHKGKAYMIIADAERALNHRSAAVKAMKMATNYPATRAKASAWLKKAGY